MKSRLTPIAFILFLVSMVIPAFRLAGDEMFGFQAASLGAMVTPAILVGGTLPEGGQAATCVFGTLANGLILIAFVLVALGKSKGATWFAVSGAIGAVMSVAALVTGSEAFTPDIGCLLWLGAMAMLVTSNCAGFRRLAAYPRSLPDQGSCSTSPSRRVPPGTKSPF